MNYSPLFLTPLQQMHGDKIAARIAEVLGIKQEDVWAAGRHREIVRARSLLCY